MNWLDVAGPPGSGKSTICYSLWGDREVTTDNLPLPVEWHEFIDEIGRLLDFIASKPPAFIPELGGHLNLFTPAVRMCTRSLHKMAAVYRMPETDRGPFIQAGFIQRGLGFGWRMVALGEDVDRIRPFFRLMPVSLGAVFLEVSVETAIARNKARRLVPETAHEDRSYQVPRYQEPIRVAKDELRKRGVPTMMLDVENSSPEESRAVLVDFARRVSGK